MEIIEKFLKDNNYEPIDEVLIKSKSNKGSFHKVLVFANGKIECDCPRWQFKNDCRHVEEVKKIKK